MSIPWYMSDSRFEPGTVADVGYSIRLILSNPEPKPNEWRLHLAIRTRKTDGVKDYLIRPARVATFKKCQSLKEAQERAEQWFSNWRNDLF
ncbi:hypothetical protein IHV10_22265 [Fictibacillus sp. 5RED26]|uniref:hypothetical protein n=1 Tax=Fictibacillus sp. 5RED26 TaxID=2745876 RepID=UPI0018CD6735|nr:hypothetical protein [Fictibacillus sp. 5RED26]MBH0159098.1 hypothetical protein [Fictibacillus sp. 5RED26]